MNLISTIPRSGTWYITCVLHCYYMLLKGKHPVLEDMFKQGMSNQIDDIIVCHMIHPDSGDTDELPLHGYNWGNKAYKDTKFDTVTFVYRDAGDQVESYWKHTRDHLHEFPSDRQEFNKLAEKCYNRMAHSYQSNPCASKINYNELVKSPAETMSTILIGMGKSVDMAILQTAVALCSRENIKKAELKAGKTLARDTTRRSHATTQAAEMSQGMIIIPTRNRIDNLKRLVQAFKDTNATEPVALLIDADDNPVAYSQLEKPDNWEVQICTSGPTKGISGLMNEFFERCPNLEYYAILADDVVPETQQWDIRMKSMCLPNKIVWANDSYQGPRLPTHPFIGGDLVRELGWIAHPELKHWYVDNVWSDIARRRGCGVYSPGIKLTHHHWINGLAEKDETYLSQPDNVSDRNTYEKINSELNYG